MPMSLSLAVQPSALVVQPGTIQTARLSVRNTGSQVAQVKLRARDIDPSWVHIEPDQLGVFPGDEASATVRVIVPGGTTPATYPVTFAASSQTNPAEPAQAVASLSLTVEREAGQGAASSRTSAPVTGTAEQRVVGAASPSSRPAKSSSPSSPPIRLASPGSGQLEVAADRSNISLLPGTQEHVELTLRNNGGSALPIEISVEGPPSQWLALSQTSALLAPAQTVPVTLTLSAPQDAPTGGYPLVINAQSRDDPAIRVRLEFVFEIAEPGKLVVELVPTQIQGQVSGEYQVRVTHSGATPLDVRLSASDDEAGCNYTFNPAALLVSPQETAVSRLTVTARQPLVGADTHTFRFTVTATTAQGITEMSQVQGRFTQEHVPPLQLSVNPERQSGPGPVTFSISITNPTQVQTMVRLTASDSEGACRYQFDPSTVTVPAKGVAPATLTVTPIEYHSEPGDQLHSFTIRAQPAGGLLTPVEAGGTFLQTAMARPILSLSPTSQSAAGNASYNLQVSNPRATLMEVEITPTGGDGMCEFTVSPTQASIPANGRVTARLNVRPTSSLLPGEQRRTCPFKIQVRTTDLQEPVEVKGSLIQVPGVPMARWLTIAGAAALGLLLCIGAFLFLPSSLSSLGSRLSNVADLSIPTPLPAVTPLSPPTIANTPEPAAMPPAGAPPEGNKPPAATKPPAGPNTGATMTAAAKSTQTAATQTASAQQTANANATATANAQKTAQAARFAQYDGNWVNDDSNTSGITKLSISNSDATISVHGFGKCSPTDCDWGTRNKTFTNEPFTILFDFGGGLTHQLTLTKQGNKLSVVDVGSRSGTNTYTFHTVRVPPIEILPLPPIEVLPKPPVKIQPNPPLNQP